MEMFAQILSSGIAVGMIYAVIAFGFQLTFATSGTLNFGQGEALMLGALVGLTCVDMFGMNYWLMIPIVCLFGMVQGGFVELIGVRPAMQFNSRYLSKGGSHWKLGAHQDWRTGQGSLDSIVMWFPMVDCGADLGALQIVPASHTIGLLKADTSGYLGSIQESIPEEDYVQTHYVQGGKLHVIESSQYQKTIPIQVLK